MPVTLNEAFRSHRRERHAFSFPKSWPRFHADHAHALHGRRDSATHQTEDHADDASEESSDDSSASESETSHSSDDEESHDADDEESPPGHGRHSAADYAGAEHVNVNHPDLCAVDPCLRGRYFLVVGVGEYVSGSDVG